MIVTPCVPPRTFTAGRAAAVAMRDCGRVRLETDEQVTFVDGSGGEYDVARKSWGYYATPSLNHRLPRFGLRGVLVRNRQSHLFLLLVQRDRADEFERYRNEQELEIVMWLDQAADPAMPQGAPAHAGA
jgi:hypothetical protein